jgi:hypothetical protein
MLRKKTYIHAVDDLSKRERHTASDDHQVHLENKKSIKIPYRGLEANIKLLPESSNYYSKKTTSLLKIDYKYIIPTEIYTYIPNILPSTFVRYKKAQIIHFLSLMIQATRSLHKYRFSYLIQHVLNQLNLVLHFRASQNRQKWCDRVVQSLSEVL